jgi:hypothetical protein
MRAAFMLHISGNPMRILLVILALFVASACAPRVDKQAAEAAVQAFHAHLDAGQFDTLYVESAEGLKQAVDRKAFLALLAAVHQQLGDVRSTKQKRWTVKSGASSALLTLDYATTFASGQATEQFVYRMKGNGALLVGYTIDSASLHVK